MAGFAVGDDYHISTWIEQRFGLTPERVIAKAEITVSPREAIILRIAYLYRAAYGDGHRRDKP